MAIVKRSRAVRRHMLTSGPDMCHGILERPSTAPNRGAALGGFEGM
jgi:hypothetical protein